MKRKIICSSTAFLLLLLGQGMHAEDLLTVSGRKYQNFKVNAITGKGIEILHAEGVARVPFKDLPEEFLRKNPDIRHIASRKKVQENQPAASSVTDLGNKEDLEAYKRRIYEAEVRKLAFQKLFMPAPPDNLKTPPVIMQNLLFVNGDNGSGTAFKMQFGQLPVIITNAHVFLGLQNPVIRDINGRRYKILSVFGARERDLVILTYRRKKQEGPLLRPVKDLSTIQIKTQVTAYGNSQGSQTHSVLAGTLLGLGYDRMEISCGIVGGNSGGPVLLKSGSVIGVSTFLTIREVEPQTQGTRYGGSRKGQRYNIRRFATRIDNLTPSMLEILNPEQLEEERKYYALSEKILNELTEFYQRRDFVRMKTCLDSYGEELSKIDEHQWTSSYLRQEYSQKRRFLGSIFKILNEGDLILVTRLRKIWSRTPVGIRKSTVPNRFKVCSRCNGSGRINVNSTSVSQGKGGLTKIRHGNTFKLSPQSRICSVCSGRGQIRSPGRNHSDPPAEYILPESSVTEFQKCILKAEHPFNGFYLGGAEKPELSRFPYYTTASNMNFIRKNRLERIYIFKGNHRTGNATKTQLTFMFNRLMRVELFIPYSEQASADYQALLRNNFNNRGSVFQVKLSRSGSFLHLDCRHEAYTPLRDLSADPQKGQGNLL